MPETAHIALGSNLGHRQSNVAEGAMRVDALPRTSVTAISSLYETKPVGKTDQPRFVNAVIEVETNLDASDLMTHLLRIEQEMGRVREEINGPRVIDLDLLLLGGQVIESAHVTIPHPRMGERHFVLVPLLEVAPDVIDPATGKAWREALDTLPPTDWGEVLADE